MPAKKKEPKAEEPVCVDEVGCFVHELEGAKYEGGVRRYISAAAAAAQEAVHAGSHPSTGRTAPGGGGGGKAAGGAASSNNTASRKDEDASAAGGDSCLAVFRHGTGTYTSPKLRYTGEWHEDVMEGKGTLQFLLTRCTYTGDFKNGKFDGCGVYEWADGSSYDGEWRGNRMHGTGVYTDVHGNVWKGQYFNGTGPGLSKVYHSAAIAPTATAAATPGA